MGRATHGEMSCTCQREGRFRLPTSYPIDYARVTL